MVSNIGPLSLCSTPEMGTVIAPRGAWTQGASCFLAAIRRAALVKACMALRRATLSKDRPPFTHGARRAGCERGTAQDGWEHGDNRPAIDESLPPGDGGPVKGGHGGEVISPLDSPWKG